MATQSWSSRVRHDTDATFREWGSDFAAKMALVGMSQTADTGQINWTTVVRPVANTNAGFEIWVFTDTLQATAPIYVRIDYGTGNVATAPAITITVGTGTNGAGTITGVTHTARRCNGSAAQATDVAYQSYMCHTQGFFGFSWKVGSGTTEAGFFITRTADEITGAATSMGSLVHWGNGTNNSITARQAFRYAAPAVSYQVQTSITAASICVNALGVTSTAVGADLQLFLAFTITPKMSPVVGICGYLVGEIAPGTTFSATLLGSTSRTYIAISAASIGSLTGVTGAAAPGLAAGMLWE